MNSITSRLIAKFDFENGFYLFFRFYFLISQCQSQLKAKKKNRFWKSAKFHTNRICRVEMDVVYFRLNRINKM